MESIQTIFANTIKENADNHQFLKILQDVSFDLTKQKIQRLKDDKKIRDRVGELFDLYCITLEQEHAKSAKNIAAVICGLLRAASHDKEEFLYKTIYEKEQLEKSINQQKSIIKEEITGTYQVLEKHIESLPEDTKEVAFRALHDTKLNALEMLGILRETTEEALLTTLEKGSYIQETTFEISKNLAFQGISDGDFDKRRFLDIANTIIDVTLEIAQENINHSKELIYGAVDGVKEGIAKSIDKFKNDIKFAPDEVEDILGKSLAETKKELLEVEDEYIRLLKNLSVQYDEQTQKILYEKVEKYNSTVERLKRATHEASEAIANRIEELKEEVSIEELKELASEKFESLKKDVNSFEEMASEKFESFKKNETTKKATLEAKKLGLRAWEVAKTMLDSAVKNAKESMKKDEK
ncbi:MAG: hypothetical protein R3331_07400 [Sulfurospirillaceae bacterium]|nr:hypothetical protein [Sulfurospirillaceae bacterium]